MARNARLEAGYRIEGACTFADHDGASVGNNLPFKFPVRLDVTFNILIFGIT